MSIIIPDKNIFDIKKSIGQSIDAVSARYLKTSNRGYTEILSINFSPITVNDITQDGTKYKKMEINRSYPSIGNVTFTNLYDGSTSFIPQPVQISVDLPTDYTDGASYDLRKIKITFSYTYYSVYMQNYTGVFSQINDSKITSDGTYDSSKTIFVSPNNSSKVSFFSIDTSLAERRPTTKSGYVSITTSTINENGAMTITLTPDTYIYILKTINEDISYFAKYITSMDISISCENYYSEEQSVTYGNAKSQNSFDMPKIEFNELTYNNDYVYNILPNKVLEKYKYEREVLTLRVGISTYYDENDNAVIGEDIAADDEGNTKMTFTIGDIVVPYKRNAVGQDVPVSTNSSGEAKEFRVCKVEIVFDGAIWQNLTLVEV